MILRDIKNKIKNSKFRIIILASLFIYIFLFLCIKNEFFYSASQYNHKYLDYYIQTYLAGEANDLIFENDVMMYIESGVKNIYSALYLYVVTFSGNIYLLFSILISIYIFYYISSTFYCDIYKGNSLLQIFRIGEKKYIKKTIISNSLYCGLLILLPRIMYYLLLNIFFPNGVSYVHFLGDTSFISEKFLYVGYNYSPFLMICLDFVMSFCYGIIISLISLIIVSIIKNKSLSYIIFVFAISAFSIIPLIWHQVPLIFYSSIYTYSNMLNVPSIEINVYEPIVISTIMLVVLLIVTKFVLKYRVRKFI